MLARPRYGRSQIAGDEESVVVTGHRHGSRTRSLTGTFGPIEIAVPRARLNTTDSKTTEWKSKALRAYQRRTLAADALIRSTYLAGTNTRRVRRAAALLAGRSLVNLCQCSCVRVLVKEFTTRWWVPSRARVGQGVRDQEVGSLTGGGLPGVDPLLQ
jgi:hypothetical protein